MVVIWQITVLLDQLPILQLMEKIRTYFLPKKHAKSALAMAQISQLIPFYGGEITDEEWKDSDMKKYVITRDCNEIKSVVNYIKY